MTFEEYEQTGRTRYVALVDAVQNILRRALQQHNLTAYAVTGRAKDPASLRKKLCDRGIALDQPMDEIKDLAGCRVVFLTNSQVDAFNQTRALHENFEVLNVNVHHPVPGTATETRLFDSTNYLVRLKNDRLALVEYREFDGLSAEIQIQTLLNHAWAEMGHDTIYKEPKLTHLGAARMTAIGERMNKVMQNHLIPAGHDFDKIAGDFRRLLYADGIVEPTLYAIYHADNNNELEAALGTYADLVLPYFDKPEAEFSKLLETLIGAVERSRDYGRVPIDTQFGEYPGKSSLDVASRVASLIGSYRYCEIDRVFEALIRLCLGAPNKDEQQLWIGVGKKLADYNLDVWTQYGSVAQQTILAELEKLESKTVTTCRPLLVAMLASILSADLNGATWRSDSCTIHRGTVPASNELRRLRAESIGWLEQWLDAADSDSDRRTILQALDKATAAPMHGGDSGELIQMLLKDGSRVARFIVSRVCGWGLELRREREVAALHTHYQFHALPPDLMGQSELAVAQKDLVDALEGLRDQLAADDDFMLYKTLIGYDSVWPNAWDGDYFDFNAGDEWRRDRYPMIIANMTVEGVPEWKARIDAYVDAADRDGGHFEPTRKFLELLAEQKPDVALLMLEEMSLQRSAFLSAMLAALERAGRKKEVLALIDRWLADGQFLSALGAYFRLKPENDVERLQAYVAKAIEQDEEASVVGAATTAAVWYRRAHEQNLIDNVLMAAVEYTVSRQIPYWIKHFFVLHSEPIIQALSEEQSFHLLKSFVNIPEVDYSAVHTLVAVSSLYPQLVIDFFNTRLRRGREEAGDRFDPVPFYPHNLGQAFFSRADLLLRAARKWYEDEPSLHELRGGRLVKHTFPKLTEEVAALLIKLVREGDESDLSFTLDTLRPYESAEEIYPVCMEVVDRLEPGHTLLTTVSKVLDEKGVLSGEFGYVKAHSDRRDRIEQYRDDPRPRVGAYARDRARELAQYMAWEQRRAEGDVAQRRRDWDEE